MYLTHIHYYHHVETHKTTETEAEDDKCILEGRPARGCETADPGVQKAIESRAGAHLEKPGRGCHRADKRGVCASAEPLGTGMSISALRNLSSTHPMLSFSGRTAGTSDDKCSKGPREHSAGSRGRYEGLVAGGWYVKCLKELVFVITC